LSSIVSTIALDHVGRASDQHEQVGDAADRLIGVANPVVDMDRAGRGDETDEQPAPTRIWKPKATRPMPFPRTLAMIAPRPMPTVATIITNVS
jgi:hypothetical protein